MPAIQRGNAFRTTVRLPERLRARLERLARREGRSINTTVVGALTAYVEEEEKKIRGGL